MTVPVGALGMTAEEHAEFLLTGMYPQRSIDAPNRPPGFGPAATNPSLPKPVDLPPMEEFAAAIRDFWRLDGKLEGRRDGLEEGLEKGRVVGREEVLREKLTEVLQAANSPLTAPPIADEAANKVTAPSKRGPGRPSTRDDEADEMLVIRAANPDRGERYCRNLFEGALREREAPLTKPETAGKSDPDGKRWRNERSKRAWEAAHKKLFGDA